VSSDALLQAYRRGDLAEISEAEVAYQDERLAAYGDVGALLHAEPPGYAAAFVRVMDEMADIEAQARANPLPPPMVVDGDFVYLREDYQHGAPLDVLDTITAAVGKRHVRGDKSKAPTVPGYRVFMALVPVKDP
jgi:hypothetical protein